MAGVAQAYTPRPTAVEPPGGWGFSCFNVLTCLKGFKCFKRFKLFKFLVKSEIWNLKSGILDFRFAISDFRFHIWRGVFYVLHVLSALNVLNVLNVLNRWLGLPGLHVQTYSCGPPWRSRFFMSSMFLMCYTGGWGCPGLHGQTCRSGTLWGGWVFSGSTCFTCFKCLNWL